MNTSKNLIFSKKVSHCSLLFKEIKCSVYKPTEDFQPDFQSITAKSKLVLSKLKNKHFCIWLIPKGFQRQFMCARIEGISVRFLLGNRRVIVSRRLSLKSIKINPDLIEFWAILSQKQYNCHELNSSENLMETLAFVFYNVTKSDMKNESRQSEFNHQRPSKSCVW